MNLTTVPDFGTKEGQFMQYKDVGSYWRGEDTLAYTAKSVPCL